MNSADEREPPNPSPSDSRELNPRTPFVNDDTAQLRKELEGAPDARARARLLYELGEIYEQHGDEPSAQKTYAEAHQTEPESAEPLEAIIRLLEKKRALSKLAKPYEDLAERAQTPEEKARALLLRAQNLEDVQRDYAGARDLLRAAIDSGATPVDIASAWLSLEIVAAKLGDESLRAEALLGRASHAANPDWRGLLHVAAARTCAELGDIERALPLLDRVIKEEGRVAFHAIDTAIRLLEKRRTKEDTHPSLAPYLERAALLVEGALTSEARARAIGLPEWLENLDAVIDYLIRAADLHEHAGALNDAKRVLEVGLVLVQGGASDSPPSSRTSLPPKDVGKSSLERLLLNRRMRLAEREGDTETAAKLASRRLIGEDDGGIAAALSIRVAEEAVAKKDVPRAMKALSRAVASDPESIPARALHLDLLSREADAAALASEIERFASQLPTPTAQSRAFLLSAYLWATRVKDANNAKAALAHALENGAPAEVVARESRALAALAGDDEWHADSTRRLLDLKIDDWERALLWFDLLRSRLSKSDLEGANDALRELGATKNGREIAVGLSALLPEMKDSDEALKALDSLLQSAEGAPNAKLLTFYAALRAHAKGDIERTKARLRELVSDGTPDPLVLAYLIDLERAAGDRAAVAALVASGAHAVGEGDLAASLHIEAGIERWALGDRAAATASFETARDIAPKSASPLVAWALRAVAPDHHEARAHALDIAAENPRDVISVAFDRFANESIAGDHAAARRALTAVGEDASRDFVVASALAHLISPQAASDDPAIAAALDVLESISSETERAAASERARLSRTSAPRDLIDATHAWVETGGGTEAKLEWLSASIAGGDTTSELRARESIAESDAASAEVLRAQSKLIEACTSDGQATTFARGNSTATRLANLELAPPGTDPRRRRAALVALRGTAGAESVADTQSLSGWSALLAGDAEGALSSFLSVTKEREKDLSAWEGVRTAATLCGRRDAAALACEQLGARLLNDERGAAFWEEAGVGWFSLGPRYEDRGERAFDAAFRRDPRRTLSFERLFRRVRDKKNFDRLLFLIETRLRVAKDHKEITKLHWEEARVRREKGDPEGALRALQRVTELEPEHVGALALTGEIFIRRGMYEEAADRLARLSRAKGAPPMNRVTAGVTAVDLFENKLDRYDLALDVLNALHDEGLSTLPVRERLARAAARTGAWDDATRILEELMHERPTPEGRVEAARLAAAIHRDRIGEPFGAMRALEKLLQEIPGDAEGVDALLEIADGTPTTIALLTRARETFMRALETHPGDANMVNRLARVTHAIGDTIHEQAAWSVAIALAGHDIDIELRLRQIDAETPRIPNAALTDAAFSLLCATGDDGPISDLFRVLGPTLAEAFGPNMATLGVTKRDKIDPRSGLAIYNEITSWAAAFGLREIDVYVGGKEPTGIAGIGPAPAIVIGPEVNVPLSLLARARLGRELLGIVRGTTVTTWRDDSTISAIVVASCALAKIPVKSPPNAALAEVERLLGKAMSRKVRNAIEPICMTLVKSKSSARAWATRARLSQSRAGVITSGSIAAVLADLFNEPMEDLGSKAFEDLRSEELMRFILSPHYAELRIALGLAPGGA